MSMTWTEEARAPIASARMRLVSLSVASAVCAALVYLAATQQFGVIADTFDVGRSVEVIVEEIELNPPAPLVRNDPPPLAPTTSDFAETPPLQPVDFRPVPSELAPPQSALLTNASFLERPSGRDFARYYPDRALARGQGGRVVLDCRVGASGTLACVVMSEDPPGWGFGAASLQAAEHFRVAPATADGRPTSEGRLRVPMTWRAR